jgi:hypothetical protein
MSRRACFIKCLVTKTRLIVEMGGMVLGLV